MSIITTQDGYRSLAARCGDYRPSETEPEFTYEPWWLAREEHLKAAWRILKRADREAMIKEINEEFPIDPTNPDGLDKATVTLWKQDGKSNVWHPVNGWARWRDYAPIREEWAENNEGKWRPTGRKFLDTSGNWGRMGHVMLAKCANSAGLRAGWPAVFSGVYSEEEFDRARIIDLTASEIVKHEQEEQRAKLIGMAADEYPTVDDQGNLSFIPAGRFVDHFLGLVRGYEDPAAVDGMLVRNREGFNRFWTRHKDDALELRTQIDARRAELAAT
jgi:hypothetical protein